MEVYGLVDAAAHVAKAVGGLTMASASSSSRLPCTTSTPLTPADVHSVLGYYLRHRAEIDAHLGERRRQAEELLQSAGSRVQPWPDVRERLQRRAGGESQE